MPITMEQATQRVRDLLDKHDDYVPIELIEDDEDFAESREIVTAAARALATSLTSSQARRRTPTSTGFRTHS